MSMSAGETQPAPSILVVDDEPAVREALRAGLEFEGYQVTVASDGLGALEQIAKAMPDGMVLDVMMPRMDGWETAIQLRRSPGTAHIKVVLITARAQEDDKTHGARVGADAYLTKPFDPDEMIRVVRELVASDLQ